MKNSFTKLIVGLIVLLNYSLTQAQTVTTFAGSTEGYADGTGTAAQFNKPYWICSDAAENLYVSDTYNHRIRKITPQGEVTTLAGSTKGYADGIGTAAQFNLTSGICIDTSGNLYVCDYDNHRIRKITPQGEVTTLAGSTKGYADGLGSAAQFNNPIGITVDTSGNLYVSDTGNNRIRKITPDGQVTTVAGSGIQGYADGIGTATKFSAPRALTTDPSGNIYVADSYNSRIRKITPQGEVSTLAGSTYGDAEGLGTAAKFDYPYGLSIDTSGNLYVSANNRIRKITPQGEVSTLAGSTWGDTDGIGTAAQFGGPNGINVAISGNMYVVDTSNNRIRKITLQSLGTKESSKTPKVKIYPNPTKELVTIDTSSLKNASAKIYDASGKIIKNVLLKSSKNTLNVNELSKGTYFIEILSAEGKTTQKLIKQ